MNPTAWMLVLQMASGVEIAADGLATVEECKRLGDIIATEFAVKKAHCFEYRRAVAPLAPSRGGSKITT